MVVAKRLVGSLAAGAVALSPVAVQAAPLRSSSDAQQAEMIAGVSTILLLALIAAAAAIIVIVSDDDSEVPTSP